MNLSSGEAFPMVTAVMDVIATLLVILVGLGLLAVIVLYIVDVTRKKSAIRGCTHAVDG